MHVVCVPMPREQRTSFCSEILERYGSKHTTADTKKSCGYRDKEQCRETDKETSWPLDPPTPRLTERTRVLRTKLFTVANQHL